MDYEKKYKDTLERAKKLYEQGTITESLCYVFPELRESEDEKIRKELVDYINRLTVTPNNIDRYNSWIAWLEKQGEQKPAKTVKWSPQEERCICQLESLVKEQWRHAEKVNNAVDIKKMQDLMFFLKTLNPNKKPQRMISAEAKEAMYDKPACAWSEEDEKMCQETIDWFEKKCFPYALENENPARESIKWLKSIKQKIGG